MGYSNAAVAHFRIERLLNFNPQNTGECDNDIGRCSYAIPKIYFDSIIYEA